MNKKKILIFIDWFYPGFRGGGPLVSCLNLVQKIAQDYRVYIFTRGNDYTLKENYSNVELNQWIDFQDIAKIFYCENDELSFLKINKIINEVTPDIIYLNSMYSYYFTILPIIQNHFFAKKYSRKTVLVPRGMLMDGKLQFNKIKKLLFLTTFKFIGLQKKLTVQVTSLEEKEATINRLKVTDNQVYLIPNIPSTDLLADYQSTTKKESQLKIYFASRIAREKNILFVLQILKEITVPISFDIFGAIDHQEYWELCKKEIDNLPTNITVNYKGSYLPTTMKTLFQPYHAFIFPTFGENYGHVIIEALSLGKPVITTSTVPWIDIESKNAGWIIDLDNEKRYQTIIQLLFELNQRDYNFYSKAAIDYAKQHIDKVNYKALYQDFFE